MSRSHDTVSWPRNPSKTHKKSKAQDVLAQGTLKVCVKGLVNYLEDSKPLQNLIALNQ